MSFVGDPEAQDIERYVSVLESEIERLRADAARWHWLRFNGVCVPQWEEGGFALYRAGVTLDAAVDAAMKDIP